MGGRRPTVYSKQALLKVFPHRADASVVTYVEKKLTLIDPT